MKNISILGSTGSIGTQTLEVISQFPQKFRVVGLAAGNNVDLAAEQVIKYKPTVVSIKSESNAKALESKIRNTKTQIVYGEKGAEEVASIPAAGLVVSSMVGASGLKPTIAAIKAGKDIALANKETLVMAGQLITEEARKNDVKIIPVDSEHSAIYQAIKTSDKKYVRRIILTASGGPFLNTPAEKIKDISVSDALNHPTWKMGNKITIDSATLMNKCFEIIEARWLFDMGCDMISVWIHPQSIIHSMVEFVDGSIISQMGLPDMKIPISYSLNYPERLDLNIGSAEPGAFSNLEFGEVDTGKFPSINYAFSALKEGGTLPAVMNAANEVAVTEFLEGNIGFTKILETIKNVMDLHDNSLEYNYNNIISSDLWARNKAQEILRN
ncbi:MAG: 1-deoxy-D-xylulose-5-phosphate reductoisomerase [Candidatus Dadabacteria bacterium]|nr:1-deoxy-D-xylulose-5-phosphate reductoisomerase [Candidatus Dadabacteria bacterium]NIS07886.1 1-deoxy-D-xylulose-5-phosphate reductoisomerase [Candidatus Dadabacteria bacterium]NIV42906.1 1-deoxy-D-xylulose-5-phosphate reductoisomerase [Candidatus Dadabacteria bacterium]NIX14876.1 1-deoxy-D-xylulose-5-phosphate reductoisomerase [Candidatus Dadabacteria bacterium]NIY21490.1 1-deoxy-D-xylulose-5-phosphate reductoisomerase [Candidatus Dadabacteria bacterium]